MISVDTIARVRRAHFVQGKSIKAISRELRLARNIFGEIERRETSEPRQRLGSGISDLIVEKVERGESGEPR
ncbi:MAG TPA: hypothetical protein PK264_02805 [Hyphomicrobiaceae bacterium]|nr:hypothetical protein [Hyphomicrobiaceae bacterium]